MSHIWHKKLTLAITAMVGVGMLFGVTLTASASARHHSGSGQVFFSDWQWPTSLNPYQTGTVVEQEQLGLTQPAGNVAEYGPNSNLDFPQLQSAPSISNGGLTIDFELKHGMQWSDGTQVNAADYLFTWEIENNSNTGPACLGTCDNVAAVSLTNAPNLNTCLDGNAADATAANCGFAIELTMKRIYAPSVPNAMVGLTPVQASYLGNDSQRGACLQAVSGCNTSASDVESNLVNYTPTGTGGVGITMGPYVVTGYTTNAEVDYGLNGNFTCSSPDMGCGGANPANYYTTAKYLYYPDVPTLIANVNTQVTDVSEDYTLLQYSQSLQNDSALNCPGPNCGAILGGGANPEWLIFNTKNQHPAIDGGGPHTSNSIVYGQTLSSKGTKVREALMLAFNWAQLLSQAYGVGISNAAKSVSYCAPIFCASNNKAPFNDYTHESAGRWDPIKSKYEKPSTSTALTDAKKLFNANCNCSSSHKATLYIATTTGNTTRTKELNFLKTTWQNVFKNLHVTTEFVPAAKYFDNVWQDAGTLEVGHFQAAVYAFGGVPPDPDSWKGNFLSHKCEQSDPAHSPADGNNMCFQNSGLDADMNAAGNTLNPSTRTTKYQAFQQIVNKYAVAAIIAPRPNIYTTDGKPNHNFIMDSWQSNDTWNSQQWTQ